MSRSVLMLAIAVIAVIVEVVEVVEVAVSVVAGADAASGVTVKRTVP